MMRRPTTPAPGRVAAYLGTRPGRRAFGRGLCALCWLLIGTPSASGQHNSADFWAFLPVGRALGRCGANTPVHATATQRLEQLDERIGRLTASDPVGPVIAQLHQLLKTDCFLLAAEAARVPNPDTSLSLKVWADAGGRAWLWSYLQLPKLGPADQPTPHIIVPPDTRRTLALEGHEHHPLASILCRLTDVACGAETRGWRLRADASLAATVDLEREPARQGEAPSRNRTPDQCQPQTLDSGAYERWRSCVEAGRRVQPALPLGQVRSPASGWLLVAGRRGHYAFCDTVRAYDLETGAAFVDDSCSDLALASGGAVDVEATNRGRVRQTLAGRVSAENVREALWMLLLRGESERVQIGSEAHPLPAGLVPGLVVGEHEGASAGSGALWLHTGQTSLTWRWRPRVGTSLVGHVTWPDSSDAAEHHAAALLHIAEQSFRESCPPMSIPSSAVLLSGADHALNDVSDEDAKRLRDRVGRAVERWRQLPPCASH